GGLNQPSASHVSDGTTAHNSLFDPVIRSCDHAIGHREQGAVLFFQYLAFMREIKRWQLDALALDVLPDVKLRPIAQRKDAHLFAGLDPPVVEVPELRTLGARLPLPELISEREDPFLRPRFLFIATGSAQQAIKV